MVATFSTRSPQRRRPTLRTVAAMAVIVALLLAGAVGLLRLRGGAAAGPSGASQTKPISLPRHPGVGARALASQRHPVRHPHP